MCPDREADTFAAWLRAHPGIQVICRDRAGAPQALQVADRWHLWHNLSEHLQDEVAWHRACLADPTLTAPAENERQALEEITTVTVGTYDRRRVLPERTRQRHQAVHELRDQGKSLAAIVRQLHLGYNTVRKFTRAASPETLLAASWQHRRTILEAQALSAPALKPRAMQHRPAVRKDHQGGLSG